MLLTRFFAVVTLAAGAATLTPARASACGAPQCWPATVVPEPGAKVPANVVAFMYVPASGQLVGPADGGLPDAPAGFQLIDPEGKPVELTITGNLARPKQPLQADRAYKIRYAQNCPGYRPNAEIVEQILNVGPAVPLPTTIGTAAVTGHRVSTESVGLVWVAAGPRPCGSGSPTSRCTSPPSWRPISPLAASAPP